MGYGRTGIKTCRNYVEIQGMEIILDMEAKHHTIIHRANIGRRKQIYHQEHNLYAYALY